MPRAQQVLFVFVVYAAQIGFSHWWLSRFQYGPMEWLWRGFTYWQVPPLRPPRPPVVSTQCAHLYVSTHLNNQRSPDPCRGRSVHASPQFLEAAAVGTAAVSSCRSCGSAIAAERPFHHRGRPGLGRSELLRPARLPDAALDVSPRRAAVYEAYSARRSARRRGRLRHGSLSAAARCRVEGAARVDASPADVGLPPEHPTVAVAAAGGNGYETALVGKWHLGYFRNSDPTHGFESSSAS